jgi:nucleotide-binding universal stress UspA family protein
MPNAPFVLREVLVPTDLSEEAAPVLDHARLLAERFDAGLTLYHAVETPARRFAHWAFAHEHEVWMQAERHAREALERCAREIGARAVVERTTSAHEAIVDRIRRTRPDLVAMATHGRQGLAHLLLGSVTEKVIQRVHRPVLCFREVEHEAAFPYRRVLVTTDLSPASRLVFPLAAHLARVFEAELFCVHVSPARSLATLGGIAQAEPVVVPSEASLWRFVREDFGGLRVTAQVHTGTIWERIVEAARAERADLIVMSTRGHDSLADHVLGSNTERVVRHAPCPVLVA